MAGRFIHRMLLRFAGLTSGALTLFGCAAAPRIADAKTPFQVDDGYCAAPLAVFQGNLYAGDQQRGNLWKLVSD
jgi:hypothetical protein